MNWRTTFLILTIASLTSCGFTRNRAGYYPMEEKDASTCNVQVATMADVGDIPLIEVGKLRLGEAPFLEYSWMCDKADAIKIITREACSANANFANIVTESYPSFMQSCYHCTVILYRVPASYKTQLDAAIALSLKSQPLPDPEYEWVVIGKIIKTMALFGAAIGISTILKFTQEGT